MTYPGSGGGEWSPQNPQQFPQGHPGPYTGPQPAQPGWQQQGAAPGQQPWGGNPQAGGQFPGGPQAPGGQFPGGQFPSGQFPGGEQPYGYAPGGGEPPKKKRTGLIVTAIVAVLALAGGTVATVWALRGSSVAAGADTPEAAATNLVNALGSGDMIGVLNSLAPAEAALSKDYVEATVSELKRLEVLKPDADPNKITGAQVKVENLKFDQGAEEKINDHLAISKLTEGKITITSNAKDAPVSDKVLEAMGEDGTGSDTETIDIAERVKENGEPLRIASIKVGDDWYPSLFYTLADYGLRAEKKDWPKDSIPAQGAGSAQDAAKQFTEALLDSDFSKAIGLLPPDEMAVLHDLGPLLVDEIGKQAPSGAKVTALETDTKEVSGGTQVTIKKLTVEADGQQVEISRSGDCYELSAQRQSQRLCADEVSGMLADELGSEIPPAATDAIGRLVGGLLKDGIGVVATEVDGKWYVSPFRSVAELYMSLLRSLQPQDIEELLKAGR